jgi:hypothetical protein
MICPSCAKGGDITAKIKRGETDPVLGRVAAEEHHGECRGGTWCDCQHVVTTVDVRRFALVA